MNLRRLLLLCLLLGMCSTLICPTPTLAQVVPIQPPDPQIVVEPLLDPADVERIATLQHTWFHQIVSPVSPDDGVVLGASLLPSAGIGSVWFLDVQDGTQTLLDDDGGLAQYIPTTNLEWLDSDTLVFFGIDMFGASFGVLTSVMVTIDRTTGAVNAEYLELPGLPMSLAPGANGIVLVSSPSIDEHMSPEQLFDLQIPVRPPMMEINDQKAFSSVFHNNPLFGERGTMQFASESMTFRYLDLHSQEVITLTTTPEGTGLVSPPVWSRDGSKLAMVQMTIKDISRGQETLLDVMTQDTLGRLPPEQNPFLQGNVVQTFELDNGGVRSQQLHAADGNGDVFLRATWNDDGSTLMTIMGQPARLSGRQYPIYTTQMLQGSYIRFYDADLETVRAFNPTELGAPLFTDGQFVSPAEVIFTTFYGLSNRIYYYHLESGELREITDRDGSYSQVKATNNSRQVVFSHSSFLNPPDIYRIGWDGQAFSALTYDNVAVGEQSHVQANQLWFPLQNGSVRQGYLIQPAGAPFPPQHERIVLWQKGGPGGSMFNQWAANVESPFNLLPNFGVSVLVLPLQGRVGWGTNLYNDLANDRNFGSVDIDEAAEVVGQMIERGYTSPSQIGIVGCSYGGYFSSQSITRHPGLYAAANPQCSLLDVTTEWHMGFTAFISYLMGATPFEEPEEYRRDSPIYQADSVRTPTLMFHGTEDFLPISIALNFYAIIEQTGTPVRLLQFFEEPHGLHSPENQLIAAQEQIVWFHRYLSEPPPVEEPAGEEPPITINGAAVNMMPPMQQTIDAMSYSMGTQLQLLRSEAASMR